MTETHLNAEVEKFWSLEQIGIYENPMSNENEEALKNFNDTVYRENGRYVVKWPWGDKNSNLPTNYGLALGRFKSLLKRFKNEPDLLKKYAETIQEQAKNGVIEVVTETSDFTLKHYLPHHPVLTPTKTTTKLRIVYDASSKSNKNINCLNDCLYRGPVILPDLTPVLIQFRIQPLAIIADLEKAFFTTKSSSNRKRCYKVLMVKRHQKPHLGKKHGNISLSKGCFWCCLITIFTWSNH